jgi:putative ABC transport system permease protein
MILWRLAISHLSVRKVRTALTVAAIGLSVSLVVAVTSGYKSMEASALKYLNHYMGTADAFVYPFNEGQGLVPESVVDLLRQDPAVREASGRLITRRAMERAPDQTGPQKSQDRLDAGATPPEEENVQFIGVRHAEDSKVESIELTGGKWFDEGNYAVIDQAAEEALGLKIGDTFSVPGLKPLSLTVVGTVHKPTFFAERSPTIYVPLDVLQHFTAQDNPPVVTRITVNLRNGVDFQAFEKRWDVTLSGINTNLRLRMRRDTAGELSKNLMGLHVISYFGGVASMLTAMFITFSALSMGVTERQRTLAMLRAVGAVRGQIFRLVVIEAMLLCLLGVVGGILAGMLWMNLLYWRLQEIFSAGVNYSLGGMAFAAIGSILTALAASLIPAYSASRLSPVDAMSVQAAPTRYSPRIGWAILGLLLISIDPILFFGPVEKILAALGFSDPDETARGVRFFGHFGIGLAGIMFGYFLLAPLLVWTIEKIFTVPIAAILRLPTRLLRQQLSGGIWRAAGTAAALMVGLATLIAMQVQGHTLIGGWQLPDKFPDIFISSSDLIPWNQQPQLANVPNIAPGSLMPIAMATSLGDSKLALAYAAAMAGRGSLLFCGVDPDQARTLVQLEFRDYDGNPLPEDQQAPAAFRAAEELKKGRRIIVTDEFRQVKHLKVGDTVRIQTSVNGWQTYTICGIVWSSGADLIVSLFDLDQLLDQQTAAMVFGSIDDAKKDFGVTGAWLFAANLTGGVDKQTMLHNAQIALRDRGLRAGDVRQIKYAVEKAYYRLLLLVSTVAFSAMAVASLGVTNTVMASIRARRWQFGVLRAVGVGRGQLLRLVLAEAILLGFAGITLGLAAGLEMSVDARKLSGVVMGYMPDLLIPWHIVATGCGAVLAVALIASLWPAISVARSQPLDLLQAGRASM